MIMLLTVFFYEEIETKGSVGMTFAFALIINSDGSQLGESTLWENSYKLQIFDYQT